MVLFTLHLKHLVAAFVRIDSLKLKLGDDAFSLEAYQGLLAEFQLTARERPTLRLLRRTSSVHLSFDKKTEALHPRENSHVIL